MALIKCNKCGADISDKALKCIYCGLDMSTNDAINNLNETFQKEKEQMEEEFNSQLSQKENEKNILETKNQDLENELRNEVQKRQEDDAEKEKLKKELEDMKLRNDKLENKLDTRKKEDFNKFVSGSKNFLGFIVSAFRYFCAFILFLLAIIFFLSNEYFSGGSMLVCTLSVCPFIYNVIFKKVNVSKMAKVAIQVTLPFMLFVALGIIVGG